MNESEDFIRTYENAFPSHICDDLMNLFDDMEVRKKVFTRQGTDGSLIQHQADSYLFLDRSDLSRRSFEDRDLGQEIVNFLEGHVLSYCKEFGLLAYKNALVNEALKLQKTLPGQGFHTWHSEHGAGPYSQRVLVWMLYCNTISEGGETEFLFQKRRFKPQKNTLLIWPAGFTHTHRGGLVLGPEAKYVITGWLRWN